MSIQKLNQCIQKHKANNSRAREAIYNVLLQNSEKCLNVSQISKELVEFYPKNISRNTLYRHLNFFISCKLLITIQDDSKRAYYYIREDKAMFFSICPNCSHIAKIELEQAVENKEFESAEFITIHKMCSRCNAF